MWNYIKQLQDFLEKVEIQSLDLIKNKKC
jgi:hypothetical protein